MKRVIVDYTKLTNEILTLLVDRFPDGYDDSNIIRFKNHKNESIEAVEVKTDDTIFLVKVSTKLSDRIVNYEDDDIIVPLDAIKGIEIDDEDASNEEEEEDDEKQNKEDDYDDDDDVENDVADEENDEDEED